MHNFMRPTTATVSVEREKLEGTCPECGESQLSSYRVLSEGGWWDVTKCQSCLASIKREKGPLLGPIAPFSSSLFEDQE